MLKAKSSEIIQSALFDINNQYDNQIDDIDTSLLVESALLIAFESHKSEHKEVLQNIAHSVCNYALTIERAKIESNEKARSTSSASAVAKTQRQCSCLP